MPTGRESALSEMREQELEQAKKISEVNFKILKEVRKEYRRLLEECNDPKKEAAYDDVLDAVRWNYNQSADWFFKLERPIHDMKFKEAVEAVGGRGEIAFRGIDEHRYEVYVDNEYFGVWDAERETFVDERRNET